MHIADLVQTRYTTKAFDPSFRLTSEQTAAIETLLRFSPSSTNAQPWHFVLADSTEGKARVAQATQGFYSFNETKVLNAARVVVFCTRAQLDDAHLASLLEQEDRYGRFASADARAGQHRGRSYFVNLHRYELRDVAHWMEKQTYLAAGTLLLGAAAMGLDACPIEGFDQAALSEALALQAQGLVPSLIIALGRRAADDFNATLPKSRLPAAQTITYL